MVITEIFELVRLQFDRCFPCRPWTPELVFNWPLRRSTKLHASDCLRTGILQSTEPPSHPLCLSDILMDLDTN